MAVPNGSIDIWNFVDNVTGQTVRKWLRDSWSRRKIAALQTQVATLQSQVATLQSNYTTLEARVSALEGGSTI